MNFESKQSLLKPFQNEKGNQLKTINYGYEYLMV